MPRKDCVASVAATAKPTAPPPAMDFCFVYTSDMALTSSTPSMMVGSVSLLVTKAYVCVLETMLVIETPIPASPPMPIPVE